MQQNLKFPAQCTVIPAEELEQVSGGAPAWVGELKDQIRDKLNETAKDMYDIDNFADMVADETNCPNGDPEELLAFLSEVGHPVLSMDPLDI